jgi:Uncharacterized protein conserved in bacteria
LYGGAISVLLIDGQDMRQPLRLDSIGKGQFHGLFTLDRWQVEPTLSDVVTDFGPDLGMPKFYRVIDDANVLRGKIVHHSRCFRFDGVRIPYWQRLTENMWSISVLERLYDRLVSFDSATTGASQLVYKAHLRTLKIEGLREIIAIGGAALDGLSAQMRFTAQYQTNEGMTLLDSTDTYSEGGAAGSFSGLSEILQQFGQQLSGALQIPMVRLFGQSPTGMSATGESDMRVYNDGINQQQESKLRRPISTLLQVASRSVLGEPWSNDVQFDFRSLYELNDSEKGEIASKVSGAVNEVYQDGVIDRATALKELRSLSRRTGIFSSITIDQIEEAEAEPDLPNELDLPSVGAPPSPTDVKPGAAPSPEGAALASKLSPGPHPPSQDAATGTSPQRGADLLALRRFGGLAIEIETPAGSMRSGTDANGRAWTVRMPVDYGFIRASRGADDEGIDCYLGPDMRAKKVWIVDQRDPSGAFDEHKVLFGFPDKGAALAAYRASFEPGVADQVLGHVTEASMAYFMAWLRDGDKRKPMSKFFRSAK